MSNVRCGLFDPMTDKPLDWTEPVNPTLEGLQMRSDGLYISKDASPLTSEEERRAHFRYSQNIGASRPLSQRQGSRLTALGAAYGNDSTCN